MNRFKNVFWGVGCLVICVCLCSSCSSSKKAVQTEKSVSDVVYDYNDEVFQLSQVDVEPSFIGGEKGLDQAIQRAIKYPKEAYKNDVSGRVLCSVVIRRDGTIHNIELQRRANFLLEQEALRVVAALPKFKPAMKDGHPVSVKRTILVRFVLP